MLAPTAPPATDKAGGTDLGAGQLLSLDGLVKSLAAQVVAYLIGVDDAPFKELRDKLYCSGIEKLAARLLQLDSRVDALEEDAKHMRVAVGRHVAEQNVMTRTPAEHEHPLKLVTKLFQNTEPWFCDSCHRESERHPEMVHYSCVEGCDFDLCGACYDKGTEELDTPDHLWKVVGGLATGGVPVRDGPDPSLPALPTKLSHGAWLRGLELDGDQLRYRILDGQGLHGPTTGWVSVKLSASAAKMVVQKTKLPDWLRDDDNASTRSAASTAKTGLEFEVSDDEAEVESGPIYVVVGGKENGGIVVREGSATASRRLPQRLSHGARLVQLQLLGERLKFRRVSGTGPDKGWISVKLPSGAALVVPEDSLGKEHRGKLWVVEAQKAWLYEVPQKDSTKVSVDGHYIFRVKGSTIRGTEVQHGKWVKIMGQPGFMKMDDLKVKIEGPQEMRVAEDGTAWTQEEFFDFYVKHGGRWEAMRKWEAAPIKQEEIFDFHGAWACKSKTGGQPTYKASISKDCTTIYWSTGATEACEVRGARITLQRVHPITQEERVEIGMMENDKIVWPTECWVRHQEVSTAERSEREVAGPTAVCRNAANCAHVEPLQIEDPLPNVSEEDEEENAKTAGEVQQDQEQLQGENLEQNTVEQIILTVPPAADAERGANDESEYVATPDELLMVEEEAHSSAAKDMDCPRTEDTECIAEEKQAIKEEHFIAAEGVSAEPTVWAKREATRICEAEHRVEVHAQRTFREQKRRHEKEAEQKAKQQAAEQKAKRVAEQNAEEAEEAQEMAKQEVEAEEKARAREEAEAKATQEAEEKARAREEAEAKAKQEAEEKARAREEAEAKAKQEAEEKARAREEAEAKAKQEAEEKARAREEAEAKAKPEAEKKARAREEAEANAKQEAEEKAKRQAEQKAKEKAEQRATDEAQRRAAEKERLDKEVAEQKAHAEAEQKAREENSRKAQENRQARAEWKRAKIGMANKAQELFEMKTAGKRGEESKSEQERASHRRDNVEDHNAAEEVAATDARRAQGQAAPDREVRQKAEEAAARQRRMEEEVAAARVRKAAKEAAAIETLKAAEEGAMEARRAAEEASVRELRQKVEEAIARQRRVEEEEAAARTRKAAEEAAVIEARIAEEEAAAKRRTAAEAAAAYEARKAASEAAFIEARKISEDAAAAQTRTAAEETAAMKARKSANEAAAVEAQKALEESFTKEAQRKEDWARRSREEAEDAARQREAMLEAAAREVACKSEEEPQSTPASCEHYYLSDESEQETTPDSDDSDDWL